jgi:hypothetical protein
MRVARVVPSEAPSITVARNWETSRCSISLSTATQFLPVFATPLWASGEVAD